MMTQTPTDDKGPPTLREEAEDSAATAAYQQGYEAGYADGCLIIDNPPGVNGHTIERFVQIRQQYEAVILASWPSAYQCGYADGFDQRAEENMSVQEAATAATSISPVAS